MRSFTYLPSWNGIKLKQYNGTLSHKNMKTLYRAGYRNSDGFPSYIEGAVFTSKQVAESLSEHEGLSQEVVVFETIQEYKDRENFEKKRKARLALMKQGYSKLEADSLIP